MELPFTRRAIGTLILHWNGAGWSRTPSPTPAGGNAVLADVTAVSRHGAWAVGNSGSKALIVHWNGTVWRQVRSPALAKAEILSGVSASSARNAWAVGSSSTGRPLILHWNGTPGSLCTSRSPRMATDGQRVHPRAPSCRSPEADRQPEIMMEMQGAVHGWCECRDEQTGRRKGAQMPSAGPRSARMSIACTTYRCDPAQAAPGQWGRSSRIRACPGP